MTPMPKSPKIRADLLKLIADHKAARLACALSSLLVEAGVLQPLRKADAEKEIYKFLKSAHVGL